MSLRVTILNGILCLFVDVTKFNAVNSNVVVSDVKISFYTAFSFEIIFWHLTPTCNMKQFYGNWSRCIGEPCVDLCRLCLFLACKVSVKIWWNLEHHKLRSKCYKHAFGSLKAEPKDYSELMSCVTSTNWLSLKINTKNYFCLLEVKK